jgi:hypothetical protein
MAAGGLVSLSAMHADRAAAQATSPPPGQPSTQAPQSGPIVGGQRIQPRADQVPESDSSTKDDEKIRQLYREVLDASDPANTTGRRQHQ